jgi:hypothetical protein
MATHLLGGEKNYTSAALAAIPTANLKVGDRAFVIDAVSGGAVASPLTSGGGTTAVPVYWGGSAWLTGCWRESVSVAGYGRSGFTPLLLDDIGR